ncbi:M48 family metallopeptidase [Marinomonas ostreistagni]|uniref:M48 family metalloprotease n=1 Tax=Marinomonas ostreistagni TaxID=359209 RepID=A0ABS0Z723_9GAMM|nr:M48 family metalloprotease [Marinomonas ostreistagni]MBJ7549454.1 M48 family metalloprotease [Marinomonas ostreistagni]
MEFPPAYNYLREAISELVPFTGLNNKTIEIAILNSSQTNAFVIPGNHLFIYSDILKLINTETAFLGLLSHEISHLELHHYQRTLDNQKNEQAKAFLLMLAGVAAATAGDGEATSALWLGGMANQAENMLRYSREHEQEADRRGRELLEQSGHTTTGMNELLAGLQKQAMGSQRIEFLSTHPLPQNRLSDSLTAKQQSSVLYQPSSEEFQYFRATVLAYRATLEGSQYQSFIEQNLRSPNQQYYALALAELLLHYNTKSAQSLSKLTTSNEFIDYLKALVALTNNQIEQAENIIDSRLNIAPDNLTFLYLKGQMHHSSHYLKIQNNDLSYEKRMKLRHNIAIAKKEHNKPYALYQHALLQFELGQDKPALHLLNRVLKQATDSDKDEVSASIEQLERLQEAQKSERLE